MAMRCLSRPEATMAAPLATRGVRLAAPLLARRTTRCVPQPAPVSRGAAQRVRFLPKDNDAKTDEDDKAKMPLAPADVAPAAPAATAAPAPQDNEAAGYPADFVRRRLLVFVGIVIGYTTFYLTRGSLTYSAPLLLADKSLGLSLTDIGAMTSIFPMAYGVSKFVSGVVASTVSSRVLLGVGLALTAGVNLAFGASSVLPAFVLLWGMNGMLQGVGAPACASILTRWFASKERGTYWGMWNVAHNLGGFLAPVIVGGCAKAFGWRWGMWAPGAIGLAVACFVLGAVRDRPTDLGYSAVDAGGLANKAGAAAAPAPAVPAAAPLKAAPSGSSKWRQLAADQDGGKQAPPAAAAAPAAAEAPKAVAAKADDGMMGALKSVVKLPAIWALAFTYFFVYVVRQGVTSWLVFYLMAEKGAADAASAALTVSGLELGGLAGSTCAGFLSDLAIRRAAASGAPGGNVGRRIKIVMLYVVGMAGALAALHACPAGNPALQAAIIAMLGFTIYGPQMLIGLSGAELVSPAAVGASQGILGWIAYLGAANAGIPLSMVVQAAGWNGFFTTLMGACAVAFALLATVSNAPSYLQRQEKGTTKPALA